MQLAEAAQDEAAFSMRALRHLASRANLAVSPLSLHAALALLAAGARAGTLHEIASFLGPAGGNAHAALASYIALSVFADSGGEGGSGTTVRFANGIWVDADLQLKASFARVVAEHYRAEASQAFFESMVNSESPFFSYVRLTNLVGLRQLCLVPCVDLR